MSDWLHEQNVLRNLGYGDIEHAKDWADTISNKEVKTEMLEKIRQKEQEKEKRK